VRRNHTVGNREKKNSRREQFGFCWKFFSRELVSKLKKNNNNNNKNVVHCSTVDNAPSGPVQKSPQL
jgi:hypothetical protein